MELLACAPINIISRGGREGKSRGEGGVLSGAHLQTSLSLILRLLPKAAIGKLKMQEGLGWCSVGDCSEQEIHFHIFRPNLGN